MQKKKKNKTFSYFPSLSFSRLPKLSIDVEAQTARHDLHTRSCTPPNRDPNRADIYLFVHLSLCNGTPANSIRNIYIYISRAKLPPLSNHSIDAPHPSSVDYVCKRLPFLSIQFYPENLLKRLIVPVESPLPDHADSVADFRLILINPSLSFSLDGQRFFECYIFDPRMEGRWKFYSSILPLVIVARVC